MISRAPREIASAEVTDEGLLRDYAGRRPYRADFAEDRPQEGAQSGDEIDIKVFFTLHLCNR